MTTFHALITHPDGEADAADVEADNDSAAESTFEAQYGHLLGRGDVITITEDGDFAPTLEWTHRFPLTMAEACTYGILALNTLVDASATSVEDHLFLVNNADVITGALADVRRNVALEDERV